MILGFNSQMTVTSRPAKLSLGDASDVEDLGCQLSGCVDWN